MLPIDYKVVNLTPPAAIVDDASLTVAELDTAGFDYAVILVTLGATDIAMTALKVTESDTSGSGHADVTGLVYGTSTDIAGNTSALPTADDDNGIFAFEIDLRARKRYLDVTATIGDGAAGTFATVTAILSRASERPTSLAEKGYAGCLRA
jgi:FlaG/FlaF family flagellin (archaellin)